MYMLVFPEEAGGLCSDVGLLSGSLVCLHRFPGPGKLQHLSVDPQNFSLSRHHPL